MLKSTQLCINHLKAQSTLLCNQNNVLIQHSRNTFILKRKYPVPLHKKYQTRPRMTHKHYIYELVEDTNTKPQKKFDVILLETVKQVGEKGEKVAVPSQRAYEQLILPKLAVYATPENIEKYIINDPQIKRASYEFSSQFAERTVNLLSVLYLRIDMSMDVPWTIEKWHVRTAFRLQGYIVPEDAITMPEKTISGPDLSINTKEFYVTVKINNHEEVKVRCKVFHYSSDPTRQINLDTPIYQLPNIAIFPEDQEILNSLPKHRLAKKETDEADS